MKRTLIILTLSVLLWMTTAIIAYAASSSLLKASYTTNLTHGEYEDESDVSAPAATLSDTVVIIYSEPFQIDVPLVDGEDETVDKPETTEEIELDLTETGDVENNDSEVQITQ